jgi:hypothetical protein
MPDWKSPDALLWAAEGVLAMVAFMDMNLRYAVACESSLKLWGLTYCTQPDVRGVILFLMFGCTAILSVSLRLYTHANTMKYAGISRFVSSFMDDAENDLVMFRVPSYLFTTMLILVGALTDTAMCPYTHTLVYACSLVGIRMVEHFSYQGR